MALTAGYGFLTPCSKQRRTPALRRSPFQLLPRRVVTAPLVPLPDRQAAQRGDAAWQALGFGLNVHAPPDLPGAQTTCVDRHARTPPVPRAKLAAEILNHFERWYRSWAPGPLRRSVEKRRWTRPATPG